MELKPITHEGIPAALQKAERYRLLNDSSAAESICLDVLEIGRRARLVSPLAITDQFLEEMSDGLHRARIWCRASRTNTAYLLLHHLRRRPRCSIMVRSAQTRLPRVVRNAMTWYERRKPCGRRATTSRFCAGTRACACSAVTGEHAPRDLEPVLRRLG